jgi:hypothetical protein
MKTKIFISLLIFVFNFSAPTFAQFPLEVGNRWDFIESWWDGSGNSDADTIVYRVILDTLLQNGKTYFKVLPESVSLFKNLIRADSVGVYYYDTVCDTEWLFYSYDLPVGQFIQVPEHICDTTNSPLMYKTSEATTYLFGNNVNTMTFAYEGGIDNFYGIKITREFGFISWNSSSIFENYYKTLIGCELSDIVYGTLTEVSAETEKLNRYSLKQNYPNPFNPITMISWQSPQSGRQTLKVYNILGKEVATLVNEFRSAGNYEVNFDAGNLSSGVYFYKLLAGSFVETKKMILMK